MSDQKTSPATPDEAERIAVKAVGDYLNACRMTDQAQIGNVGVERRPALNDSDPQDGLGPSAPTTSSASS